jgi:hypothetical protein
MARLGGEGRAHTRGKAWREIGFWPTGQMRRYQALYSEVWPVGGLAKGFSVAPVDRAAVRVSHGDLKESNVHRQRLQHRRLAAWQSVFPTASNQGQALTKIGRRPIAWLQIVAGLEEVETADLWSVADKAADMIVRHGHAANAKSMARVRVTGPHRLLQSG